LFAICIAPSWLSVVLDADSVRTTNIQERHAPKVAFATNKITAAWTRFGILNLRAQLPNRVATTPILLRGKRASSRVWRRHCLRCNFGATSTKERHMSDNTNDRGPADRSRISLEQEHEVRYWTSAFDCSEEELRQAVASVGSSAEAVRTSLGRGSRA
jgi:hypothetical protein